MFIAAAIGIALVVLQGTYILKKALRTTKELEMDEARVKKGMKVAVMASIGLALGLSEVFYY